MIDFWVVFFCYFSFRFGNQFGAILAIKRRQERKRTKKKDKKASDALLSNEVTQVCESKKKIYMSPRPDLPDFVLCPHFSDGNLARQSFVSATKQAVR